MKNLYFFLSFVVFTTHAIAQQAPAVEADTLQKQRPRVILTNHAYNSLFTRRILADAAQKGNSNAMFSLARLYIKDSTKAGNDSAMYWYSKAADAGNKNACYYYGLVYSKALFGRRQDFVKAAHYFYKGMLLGSVVCKDEVAYFLYKGINGKQDYDSAFLLFHQLAIAFHYNNAMYFTGIFYRNGYGTERNQDSSKYWLGLAANKNDKQSIHELENDSPENPEEPIAAPAETLSIESNTVYRRIKHNFSPDALPGIYTGYIIRYDWSGKHVLSIFPVKATFNGAGENVTGTWIEGADTANIKATFTDSNLVFKNTVYRKNDHYSRKTAEKMRFTNARFNLLQQPDSLYITGNIQLYDLKRKVPARPIYIHLSRIAQPALLIKYNIPLEVKAFPNPFHNQFKVEFVLASSQKVSISLVNMQGQIIMKEDAGLLQPGTYQHEIQVPATAAAGNYMLLVNAGTETKKVNVLKTNN